MDTLPDSKPTEDNGQDRYFHHLFQDSIDPIIFTDMSGQIIVANGRSQAFFEMDTQNPIGLNISSIQLDSDEFPSLTDLEPGSLHQFNSTLQSGTDKNQKFVEVFVSKYQLDGASYLQWIFRDLTKQIVLEQLRKDLTATLVHDLQGPLGNVLSSLDLVKSGVSRDVDPVLYDLVDIALHSSQHLQWLVDSLLDISRLEAGYGLGSITWIDINTLIDHVYAVQEPEFQQRQVKLSRSIDQATLQIKADESILRRILLNLFNNALKYSQQDQTITIRTRLLKKQDEILFSIDDQGQGVPEEYRELIFEKYERINNGAHAMGLGLGLAFCRLAVEAHGGRIWVEDAPGGGACFCFTLPHGDTPEPSKI